MIHDLVFWSAKISEKIDRLFYFELYRVFKFAKATDMSILLHVFFLVSFRRCITCVDPGSYYVR